jgi:hypothetical protein
VLRRQPSHQAAGQTPVTERYRRLAERFLEDEALRGDLEDAAWQPIQDRLLREAEQLAASTADMDDAQARPILDRGQARIRQRAAEMVAAAAASGERARGERPT